MNQGKWEGIIFDFDGTISKNSLTLIITFLKDFIHQWLDVPEDYLKAFLKTITVLPMKEATVLLFKSLGLLDHLEEFLTLLTSMVEYKGIKIRTEQDFPVFIQSCQDRGIETRIFSSAGIGQARFHILSRYFLAEHFLTCDKTPKADPRTYKEIITRYGINPQTWIYIDDSPLALWSAKSAGFTTVMMLNEVFTAEDYTPYQEYIDFSTNSFSSMNERLSLF